MAGKIILPGIPQEPDPKAGIALPMMRGFLCPVVTPFMGGGDDSPPEGIGCGWSNVAGHGLRFFITIHAEGGLAMVAQLDYARYLRFAENFAAIGRQAMLSGDLDTKSEDDPLGALAVAHEALTKAAAKFDFYEESHRAKAAKMDPLGKVTPERDATLEKAEVNREMAAEMRAAIATVAKALHIEEKADG